MDINTDEGHITPLPLLHNGAPSHMGCYKTVRMMPQPSAPPEHIAQGRRHTRAYADGSLCNRRQLLGRVLAASAWAAAPLEGLEAAAAPPGAWELRWKPLHAGLWMIQAHQGDADQSNRGLVANILLAQDEKGFWLVGSGPSPVAGGALQSAIRSLNSAKPVGQPLALLSPWAHPETVLGALGLGPHRHWAHAEVAQQMTLRCPGCLQRLAHRMGPAAIDLDARPSGFANASQDPIQIPVDLMKGTSGRWGPFDWRRRLRSPDVTVLTLRHRTSGLVHAPGLLWGDAPPDGRDAETEVLSQNIDELLDWGRGVAATRWLGQQGGVVGLDAVRTAAAYWRQLNEAAIQGQERGDDGFQAPTRLEGVPDEWLAHPHHTLNWQRTWRQAESRWLQRNLR